MTIMTARDKRMEAETGERFGLIVISYWVIPARGRSGYIGGVARIAPIL
jgi:hypothetical protein